MLNPITHRRVLKKGMPGTAAIVTMGVLDSGARSFNLPITLQVYVEGIPPTRSRTSGWSRPRTV